jgi:hypothetical protein
MPQSPILLYEHIVQGQFQAEVFSNEADDILERKITSSGDIDLAGNGAYALSNDEVRDMRLNFTGVIDGNRTIELPARNMLYLLENSTTGAFVVNVEVTGGAGISIELGRGYQLWLFCDGTDVFDIQREQTDHVTNVAATHQVVEYERVINGDTAGGGFTITLPTPVVPGKQILINQVSATNTLTIAEGGTDTMNGSGTNLTIATQWQAILLTGETATNWIAHRLTVA